MSIKKAGSNPHTIFPPPVASPSTIKSKLSSRPKYQQEQYLRHTSTNFKSNSLLNNNLIKEVKGLNSSQHHNSKHEINAHSDLQPHEVQPLKISQGLLPEARKNETGQVQHKGESKINKMKESRGDNKFVRNSMTQGETRNKRTQSTGNLKGEIAGINFGVGQKLKAEKKDERSWNQKQINQKKSSGHRSRSSVPSIRSQKNLKPQPLQLNPHKSIPQQIIEYIKKRSDVEIVQHFHEYKSQFTIKSKTLNNYLYSLNQPEADKIKNTYLNQNDSHFKNGFEAIMLKLYRNGTIVPQSYTNLRQEAVEEIQRWVLGWIHRKINYGKLVEDEDNQVVMVEDALKHLDQYRKIINSQDTSF